MFLILRLPSTHRNLHDPLLTQVCLLPHHLHAGNNKLSLLVIAATATMAGNPGDPALHSRIDDEVAPHEIVHDGGAQHRRSSIEQIDAADTESESEDLPPVARRNSVAMMEHHERSELVRIATALSRRQSSVAVHPMQSTALSDIDESDPALNPEDNGFDLEKWLRKFVKQHREEGMDARTTGVAYRDLDVYGSGNALQLQDTVGSFAMAPLKPGQFLSFGKKEPKQILHGFDGILGPGELLIVLGRPGSGCSTLLKTMCGELEGLDVGEKSKIHYNGIPQKQMMKEFKGETVYNQEVSKTT